MDLKAREHPSITRPVCITDLTANQLQELVKSLGEPDYRAKQLQHWVYHRLALAPDEISDLPQSFRQRLAGKARLHSLTAAHGVTGHDGTVKILFALADGRTIESALMGYSKGSRRRQTVCVSTQVGCPVGCPFCATGQQGFERNLTPGEITDQVLHLARYLRDQDYKSEENASRPGRAITNIVFMGMGEPLANYGALWPAIEMLNSPDGFGLSTRRMVVSTAGLVPQIERLGQEKLQVELAVSLHASDNKLRDKLVPLNRRYPLEQLIPACRQYYEATGRRISFEYALFDGINDSIAHARSLARLLRGLNCHVNLIPANPTADRNFRPSSRPAVLAFEGELKQRHINATLRQPRGGDIDSGCGQLRSQILAQANTEKPA